jgi:uncharacterized protein (TIGR02147 family)
VKLSKSASPIPPSPYEILGKAFKTRAKGAPGFSLRRLAQMVDLSPSHLSRVLKGEKKFPERKIEHFVKALSMDDSRAQLLRQSVLWEIIKSKGTAFQAASEMLNQGGELSIENPMAEYDELSPAEYEILQAWYNIALLDLTTCSNFTSDPKTIAARLGISVKQVDSALAALLRAGLIQATSKGYTKSKRRLRFPGTKSLPVLRKFHRAMIQRALYVLDKQTSDEEFKKRLITGVTVAINPAQIGKAKRKLETALHEAVAILSSGECTEVYQINLQLFAMTHAPVLSDQTTLLPKSIYSGRR